MGRKRSPKVLDREVHRCLREQERVVSGPKVRFLEVVALEVDIQEAEKRLRRAERRGQHKKILSLRHELRELTGKRPRRGSRGLEKQLRNAKKVLKYLKSWADRLAH